MKQGLERTPRPQPACSEDGELGALRKTSHDKNGTNQNRNGQQLIQMAGHEQGHIHQGMLQLIALKFVSAQCLQLIDQIEKNKQSQKTNGHKTDRSNDFSVNESANGFHEPACVVCEFGIDKRLFKDPLKWRKRSQIKAKQNAPP